MRNQGGVQDRFKDYLSRKLDPTRANEIMYSHQKKNRLSDLSQMSQRFNEYSNRSSAYDSQQSIDSSAISFSNSRNTQRKSNISNCKTTSIKKKLRKVRDIQQNVCSICLGEYRDRVQMSCKHSYCNQCLQQWLKTSSRCPYCRTDCSYYVRNGEKYQIEQRQFEYEAPVEFEDGLDFQCYMCEQTNEGDQVLICDRCELYACHARCDSRLRGFILDDEDPWYCHFCS